MIMFCYDCTYSIIKINIVLYSMPLAPSEVMNLSINIINSSTLEVTWAPPLRPNGALTYSVTLSYTDLATSSMEMVFQRNETDRRVIYTSAVSDLEPYVMYGATVFAFTSVGNSPARMESIVTEDGGQLSPHSW